MSDAPEIEAARAGLEFIIGPDGCGKQSPDAKGLHIANGWFSVWIRDQHARRDTYRADPDKQFCSECWNRIVPLLSKQAGVA